MDLRYVKPEEIGIDPERLQAANGVIRHGLEAGLYPGATYLLGTRKGVVEPECFGCCDPEGERPVRIDTLYDLASITKAVVTAPSLLLLVERGEIHLGQPVATFFPGRALPHLSKVTLRQLLTHTSGLPAHRDLYLQSLSREKIVEDVLPTPLDSEPGTAYTYSCLGYILLGAIIESVSGCRLDEFARREIFRPLGMDDAMFNPAEELLCRAAATANCPARKQALVGIVHDANAWAIGGVSGNAGLFSTALDLARFCTMLLSGGMGVLSPASARLTFENLVDPAIGGQTAGWFIHPNDRLPSGDLFSKQAIGHTGFTGTSAVLDPACDLFVVLLTNRVCSSVDAAHFLSTRHLFHNAVAQAVSARG